MRFDRLMLVMGGVGAAATLAVQAIRERVKEPAPPQAVSRDYGAPVAHSVTRGQAPGLAAGELTFPDGAVVQILRYDDAVLSTLVMPARTIKSVLKEEIDVRDFGAKCDVPPSGDILRMALAAARAAGKRTFKGCFSTLSAD